MSVELLRYLVMLHSSAQFQSHQEEDLGQEQADNEIAMDRVGIGLQAADDRQTDESCRQEHDGGH